MILFFEKLIINILRLSSGLVFFAELGGFSFLIFICFSGVGSDGVGQDQSERESPVENLTTPDEIVEDVEENEEEPLDQKNFLRPELMNYQMSKHR